MAENPFAVINPEDRDPRDIAQHFVEIFTDLPRLAAPENTFIHGARGTGKSMMLRSLEASVMLLHHDHKKVAKLPHIGVHVPLKKLYFGITELRKPQGSASFLIGEQIL